jgi:hypothetical protein
LFLGAGRERFSFLPSDFSALTDSQQAALVVGEHLRIFFGVNTMDIFKTSDEVLAVLREIGALPEPPRRAKYGKHRTIYEGGKGVHLAPSGHFYIDYASFPGGSGKEVPRQIIDDLEARGEIVRAFPGKPTINAWVLSGELHHCSPATSAVGVGKMVAEESEGPKSGY